MADAASHRAALAHPVYPTLVALRDANARLRAAGDRLSLLRELAEESRLTVEAALIEHQRALDAWAAYLSNPQPATPEAP